VCYHIVDECLQMYGGYGLLRGFGMERLLREQRVLKIIEGTNEIMKHTLSKNLFHSDHHSGDSKPHEKSSHEPKAHSHNSKH
jgi:alkylation response protein AidB-like acyl-CoA dehydrogenase